MPPAVCGRSREMIYGVRMAFRSLLGVALALFGPPPAAAQGAPSAVMTDLLASSVCIMGMVPEGKFEASGFIVPPGDLVITTAHSIERTSNLRIKLNDGRAFPARIERLGNENMDLALLSFAGPRLRAVELGSIEDVRVGAEVVTIGCPSGFEFSVTRGVVSSVRESSVGYPVIQTDVPVNPGSSGGPLFDGRGRVIGIIKGRVAERQRIHFALPADLARALLDAVTRQQRAYELFNEAALEGKLEEKVTLYRKALELDPELVDARYNLALTLERLGRKSDAEREYRETLRLHPDHTPAALNLGASLYEAGRLPEAAEVYRQALERDRESARLRNNLAETYRAMGEDAKARREFETILKANPGYAPAHYGLAVLFDDRLKDRRRAAEHYRRYLALAPDAADAEEVRRWLEAAEDKK